MEERLLQILEKWQPPPSAEPKITFLQPRAPAAAPGLQLALPAPSTNSEAASASNTQAAALALPDTTTHAVEPPPRQEVEEPQLPQAS